MTEYNREKIFAVIVPSEASLTAPLAVGIELTKLYILAAQKVEQLSQQTRVVRTVDDNGVEHVTVMDNPDLKWWFDQTRKIAADVAKITANVQVKEAENRIKIADMFMNSDFVPKEIQEQVIKASLQQKLTMINEQPK